MAGDKCAIDPSRFEIRENFGTPDPVLVALGKQILAGLEPEDAVGRIHVESLTIRVATHLLRHYCTASPSPQKPVPKLSQRKLLHALESIDSNLRENISLADVAETLAMSPGHFAHAFRQTTRLPLHRFVVEHRIERAKSLLRLTELPITETAHRIGCASHSHFSVLFHRAIGQTITGTRLARRPIRPRSRGDARSAGRRAFHEVGLFLAEIPPAPEIFR